MSKEPGFIACNKLHGWDMRHTGVRNTLSENIHIIPRNDLRPHIKTTKCWCRPSLYPDNDRVIVHNALDRRELHERGKKLH